MGGIGSLGQGRLAAERAPAGISDGFEGARLDGGELGLGSLFQSKPP
ncbi:MAG: hypothetical protein KatS3mg108_3537 [Isosphaeraceae bacterium]|nr:MAG: hypothetical protein KatS3mg108_3537 [Isosphaeraceae bacterium]